MKNTTRHFFTGLCLAAILALHACGKDDPPPPEPTLQERLVGDWKVTSWTNDGKELMGSTCSAFTMDYNAPSGGESDFDWSQHYADGSAYSREGTFRVNESQKELTIEYTENGPNGQKFVRQYDLDLDGDKVELSTVIDGVGVGIKAKRD